MELVCVLRELGLLSLEKRKYQGEHRAAFQYLEGDYKKDGESSHRTRGNRFKLIEGIFRLDTGKKFYKLRLEKNWNRLPRVVVDAWKHSRSGWIGF